jgi:hypothetical protein
MKTPQKQEASLKKMIKLIFFKEKTFNPYIKNELLV